jgi:hypothetical protein
MTEQFAIRVELARRSLPSFNDQTDAQCNQDHAAEAAYAENEFVSKAEPGRRRRGD